MHSKVFIRISGIQLTLWSHLKQFIWLLSDIRSAVTNFCVTALSVTRQFHHFAERFPHSHRAFKVSLEQAGSSHPLKICFLVNFEMLLASAPLMLFLSSVGIHVYNTAKTAQKISSVVRNASPHFHWFRLCALAVGRTESPACSWPICFLFTNFIVRRAIILTASNWSLATLGLGALPCDFMLKTLETIASSSSSSMFWCINSPPREGQ